MPRHRAPRANTATELVARRLSERIKAREFRPGDRLPSRSVLAREFDVSLGTVSIALRRLARTHGLRFVPGSGVFLGPENPAPALFTIGLFGRHASRAAEGRGAVSPRNTYWGPILESIVNCAARKFQAVVLIPGTADELLDLDRVLSCNVNCLICHGLDLSRETVLDIKRRGTPLVLGRRPSDDVLSVGVSYVDYDWIGGLRRAMRLFAQAGHTRVACIAQPTMAGGPERWREVFFAEAAELGLDSAKKEYCRVHRARTNGMSPETHQAFIRDETLRLLGLPEPPTALFCSGFEALLAKTLEALRRRGIVVGRDLSLVGLSPEEIPPDAWLSALVQPARELGERLVETAGRLAEEPDQVFHVAVPFNYCDRGSVASFECASSVNSAEPCNKGQTREVCPFCICGQREK